MGCTTWERGGWNWFSTPPYAPILWVFAWKIGSKEILISGLAEMVLALGRAERILLLAIAQLTMRRVLMRDGPTVLEHWPLIKKIEEASSSACRGGEC